MATASRAAGKTATTDSAAEATPAPAIDPAEDDVRAEIAKRAYARYCERGCAHGGDMEDWLAAEEEVFAERASKA